MQGKARAVGNECSGRTVRLLCARVSHSTLLVQGASASYRTFASHLVNTAGRVSANLQGYS